MKHNIKEKEKTKMTLEKLEKYYTVIDHCWRNGEFWCLCEHDFYGGRGYSYSGKHFKESIYIYLGKFVLHY